jgi:hypothetical protein
MFNKLKHFILRIPFRVCLCKGIDFYIINTWYGLHYFWQLYPFFDLIYRHRKCNTIHEYGVILFGLNLYFKIDK